MHHSEDYESMCRLNAGVILFLESSILYYHGQMLCKSSYAVGSIRMKLSNHTHLQDQYNQHGLQCGRLRGLLIGDVPLSFAS